MYTSNESGKNQIYVVPYPGPGGKTQVSTDGGAVPHWNKNRHELFYRNGSKFMVVPVEMTPTFHAGLPKLLFEGNYSNAYDLSADGKRILLTRAVAAEAQPNEIRVVLNWFEEIRQRAAAPGH